MTSKHPDPRPVRIHPETPFFMRIGHSEAATFTRISGTQQMVRMIKSPQDGSYRAAYLVDRHTFNPTSGPYLPGELGIMQDANGFYFYS